LVVAADDGRRLATLTQPADERRFNVAASRARDQMWLFHSVNPDDLSMKCLRRRLLEYCMNPQVPQEPGDDLQMADLEAAASNASAVAGASGAFAAEPSTATPKPPCNPSGICWKKPASRPWPKRPRLPGPPNPKTTTKNPPPSAPVAAPTATTKKKKNPAA